MGLHRTGYAEALLDRWILLEAFGRIPSKGSQQKVRSIIQIGVQFIRGNLVRQQKGQRRGSTFDYVHAIGAVHPLELPTFVFASFGGKIAS